MRKAFAIIVLAAACCCMFSSCNEKKAQEQGQEQEQTESYRFVKVMPDGKEQVEDISAKNDTDALKQYLSEMEKTIMANIDKADSEQYKAMYVISPKGDTLNTNNELLEAVVKNDTTVITMTPMAATPVKTTPLQKKGTSVPAK